MEYQKVIVAVDLSDDARQVLAKATALSHVAKDTTTLVHVIEPVGFAYGGDIPMDLTDIQQQLEQHARTKLNAYGKEFGIPEDHCLVLVGRPETEIHQLATEQNADLIVVGSHGRRGIQLLLGSTANGILHGAQCDVLAVRIQK